MAKSKIQWTEQTWNPVAGCTKCSQGCENCYAEKRAVRLAYMELAEWLSRSQGQVITRMPIKLLEICRRVAWQKGNKVKLQRGDKASLREVVRILQSIDNKELLNISGNALRKVKEDMYYKLTDQDLQTYKGFQWEIGKWVKAKGEGGLCTNGSSTSLFS